MSPIKSLNAAPDSVPELRYLQVFYAVCVSGGFTAAAEQLGCTQPAVSYQIRELERSMRSKLIERGGRRVLLTPAGERLRQLCRDFFSDLARVRNTSRGEPQAETLSLGSASGFGRYVLVPALHALRESTRTPRLELNLWFDSADVVLDGLERGECDAAFVYTRRLSNRLRFQPVYREELAVIVAPSLQSRLGVLDWDRLESYEQIPFVTYQEGDYVFGRWFDTSFGEQPAQVNSIASFSELEEVVDLVSRGLGASIVPRDAAEASLGKGEVEIRYAGRRIPCMNQVYLAVRAGSQARADLEALTAILGALPGQSRQPGLGRVT